MSKFLSIRFDFKRFLFLLLIGLGGFAIFFSMKYRMTGDFEPPTERERLAALGDTGRLPENIKRAFTATQTFIPMGKPEGSDWLAHFPEKGQTFEEYRNSGFNKPDKKRNIIYIQPFHCGVKKEIEDLSQVEEFCEKYFTVKVKRLPEIMFETDRITSRSNIGTIQWDAEEILDELKKAIPEDAFCVTGVTMADLYEEGLNFVFGLASPSERIGVYSFVRLASKDKKLFLKRSCKLMAHETGHIFGCDHCIFYKCLLNGANSLEEEDGTPIHLCPVCLRKLHFNIGFDTLGRYKGLEAFFEKNGFREEKQQTSTMIKFIEQQR